MNALEFPAGVAAAPVEVNRLNDRIVVRCHAEGRARYARAGAG